MTLKINNEDIYLLIEEALQLAPKKININRTKNNSTDN